MANVELCGTIHTVIRWIQTQIPIGFCNNLTISMSVFVSVSGSLNVLLKFIKSIFHILVGIYDAFTLTKSDKMADKMTPHSSKQAIFITFGKGLDFCLCERLIKINTQQHSSFSQFIQSWQKWQY